MPSFVQFFNQQIEVGDVICEIETDKATLEFESLEEGYCSRHFEVYFSQCN